MRFTHIKKKLRKLKDCKFFGYYVKNKCFFIRKKGLEKESIEKESEELVINSENVTVEN